MNYVHSLNKARNEFASEYLKQLSKQVDVNPSLTKFIDNLSNAAIEYSNYKPEDESPYLKDVLLSKELHKALYRNSRNLRVNLRDAFTMILEVVPDMVGMSLSPLPLKILLLSTLVYVLNSKVNELITVELQETETLITYYMLKENAYQNLLPKEKIIQGVNGLKEQLHGGHILEENINAGLKKLEKLQIIDERDNDKYLLIESVNMEA